MREAEIEPDAVLRETKVVAAVSLAALLLAVVVLYFMPGQTSRWWAWTIRPSFSALLMGSGYVAAVYFFARVLFASSWTSIRLGFLPAAAFSLFMILASLIHWDRFHHDHVAAWALVILYAILPILLPVLWLRNDAAQPQARHAGDRDIPYSVCLGLGGAGAALIALAVLMFVRPSTVIDGWPWSLVALSARVVAGFLILTGGSLLSVAVDGRWRAARTIFEALIVGLVFLLLALPRAWGDLGEHETRRLVLTIGLAAALLFLSSFYVRMEAGERARPARFAGQV